MRSASADRQVHQNAGDVLQSCQAVLIFDTENATFCPLPFASDLLQSSQNTGRRNATLVVSLREFVLHNRLFQS